MKSSKYRTLLMFNGYWNIITLGSFQEKKVMAKIQRKDNVIQNTNDSKRTPKTRGNAQKRRRNTREGDAYSMGNVDKHQVHATSSPLHARNRPFAMFFFSSQNCFVLEFLSLSLSPSSLSNYEIYVQLIHNKAIPTQIHL